MVGETARTAELAGTGKGFASEVGSGRLPDGEASVMFMMSSSMFGFGDWLLGGLACVVELWPQGVWRLPEVFSFVRQRLPSGQRS